VIVLVALVLRDVFAKLSLLLVASDWVVVAGRKVALMRTATDDFHVAGERNNYDFAKQS
jgi:hypothetical protein